MFDGSFVGFELFNCDLGEVGRRRRLMTGCECLLDGSWICTDLLANSRSFCRLGVRAVIVLSSLVSTNFP
jgi:hypothetical protein